jgi:hypothetical protein
MVEDMKDYNHGKGEIEIKKRKGLIAEYRPVELHLKENGSMTDKPSLAIVSVNFNENMIISQVSLEMLNNCMKELGYQITKL